MLAPREIDEYLLPTERRVIRVRMHWAVMANNLVLTGLFLLLMIVAQRYLPTSALVDNLTFYLALAAVLRFTVQTILWWIERIVITDKRVMLAEGIITHNVGMMPLSKVTDLTFRRTFGGRLLGYGTLIVESAGQIQALNKIKYMPRPEEIYEALSELIFGEKGKTRATGMLARPRFLR
jgi:uncharacterized membrane protein YdbT with pleckstrin-like domain